MPLILKNRNPNLVEWMDRQDCDIELLFNTYRQFKTINRLLSGWDKIYRINIKPHLMYTAKPVSILDIGCGAGDILRYLRDLANKDGFKLNLTGIDPDIRAIEFIKQQSISDEIQFYPYRSEELIKEGRRFDIVITNHLLHHLNRKEMSAITKDAALLARKLVIFSDIERSDIGYAAFATVAPLLFRKSYIVKDGLISIKKSFTKEELQDTFAYPWIIKKQFPFRLLAILEKEHQ